MNHPSSSGSKRTGSSPVRQEPEGLEVVRPDWAEADAQRRRDQLAFFRHRIQSGFYDSHAVADLLARRIIASGDLAVAGPSAGSTS